MRFKRHFRVERLAPDLVFLLSETEKYTLTGALYYALVPWLQETYSQEQIVAQLQPHFPAAQVSYTLNRMQKQGYITSDERADSPETAFADALNLRPVPPFRLVTLGRIQPEMLADLLVSSPEPVIDLVVTDDVLAHDFAAYSQQAVRPWLLIKVNGPRLWIGPLFVQDSACGACLTQRVALNQPVEMFLATHLGHTVQFPRALSAASCWVAAGVALKELAAWAGGQTHLINRVMTYDLLTSHTEWHTLIKRPQCPVCGQPTAAAQPLHLEHRAKHALTEAGHRSQQAAVLYQQYAHHISPITGIVPYLARIESPEHVFIYASGYNRARSFRHWQNFRRNLRSQSAGKGTDEIQARVSALCEALERYSGLAQGDETRVHASFQDLPEAVHPHTFLLYSEAQYDQAETWNATHPPHLAIPQRFNERRPIDWTPVWSLTEQRTRYIPFGYAYFDVALPDDHDFCSADSNGCAAGSSLEDAILQGFFELVERDSIALWWDNRIHRPAFDLASLSHRYIAQVQSVLEALHREMWVLDITSDLMIPAFVCVSRVVGHATEDIVLGFGAHFDVQVAVLRAMTEMNQSLPAALRGSDGRPQSQSPWETAWWQSVTIESDPYLAPDAALPLKTRQHYASLSSDDLKTDIETCVSLLHAQGLEMMVLNQTRPDVGLPVVRVIVPGLRHFWARYAPGRLYDVPVKLGWLQAPHREEDLNPRAMFM